MAQNSEIEILVVEDSLADQHLIKPLWPRTSRAAKCSLKFASDGVEALNYLFARGNFKLAKPPSLVLLDLNLPKLDGKEVLREIRKDPKFNRVPILVLTTSASMEEVNDCYLHGASCYLRKPDQLEEMEKLLQAIDTFWLNTVTLFHFENDIS